MITIYRLLIWFSVTLYFVEIGFVGSENSLQSPPFFIWLERCLAVFFSCEIIWRFNKNSKYIRTPWFWVDLIAVIPFYVGFFVPKEFLGWIRTLRVLRLLKLFRYNPNLQKLQKAFLIAWPSLKGAIVCMTVICLFACALVYQVEHTAQPDKFKSIWDCLYYCVTVASTTGFGDLTPITPLGRFLTITLLYGPAVAVCGIVFGIMSDAYQKVENNLD